MKLYGIDVSLFQGDFNFKEALKSGVKYAIIKAGENYFTDPKYERNYKEAKAADMPVGAYWLLHANDEAGVKREAKLFAEIYNLLHQLRGSNMVRKEASTNAAGNDTEAVGLHKTVVSVRTQAKHYFS